MAGYILNVPYIPQHSLAARRKDENGCWYASIMMIRAYFNLPVAGPKSLVVTGQLDIARADLGLEITDTGWVYDSKLEELVEGSFKLTGRIEYKHSKQLYDKLKLVNVPYPTNRTWKLNGEGGIKEILLSHGPAYFGWFTSKVGRANEHVAVVIGYDEDTNQVIYHDPDRDQGPFRRLKIEVFNQKFNWDDEYNMLVQEYGSIGTVGAVVEENEDTKGNNSRLDGY